MNFVEFMTKIVPDEKERIQLKEFVGYCIDTRKKFCGKFLVAIHDDGLVTASYFLNELSKIVLTSHVDIYNFMKYEHELEPLLCKSVNICSMHKSLIDQYSKTVIKKMVHGDSMTLNFKHRTPITTNEFPKLIFLAFSRQKTKLDEDLQRRAIVVHFSRIEQRNFILDFTSVDVLKWFKSGLRRLRKNQYRFTGIG